MKKLIVTSIVVAGMIAGIASADTLVRTNRDGHSGEHSISAIMGPGMMGGWGGTAQGLQGGCTGGPDMTGLTSVDQARQLKFLDVTVDLRKTMQETRFTYMEGRRNPSVDQQQLVELEKKMLDIRRQMLDRMAALR